MKPLVVLAVMIGTALLITLLGCSSDSAVNQGDRENPSASTTVKSQDPDKRITIRLPAGWEEETEPWREYMIERAGVSMQEHAVFFAGKPRPSVGVDAYDPNLSILGGMTLYGKLDIMVDSYISVPVANGAVLESRTPIQVSGFTGEKLKLVEPNLQTTQIYLIREEELWLLQCSATIATDAEISDCVDALLSTEIHK